MSTEGLLAWYRDDSDDALSELHQTNPPEFLTQEEVFLKTGVTYWREEHYADPERQEQMRKEGGFQTSDFLELKEEINQPNTTSTRMSYLEHLHEDPEVRMVTAGAIFFEVKDLQERWVRMHLKPGDAISLPPGIFHRGALDKEDYCKLYRLFLDLPAWKAHYRPEADSLPVRQQYVSQMTSR